LCAVCNDNDIRLCVNSAKAVKDYRKCTLLANSYTLPPEYDFKKDANGDLYSGIFVGPEFNFKKDANGDL